MGLGNTPGHTQTTNSIVQCEDQGCGVMLVGFYDSAATKATLQCLRSIEHTGS